MNLPTSDIIPLPPALKKRFYEPVIVLNCVSRSCVEGNSVETATHEATNPSSLGQTYFCFVDKLAQICDMERGGDTVTAFGVLQLGTVRYWFASNRRNVVELEAVREYIAGILGMLSFASGVEVKLAIANPHRQLYSDIIQRIIRFNRPRIERYAEVLFTELEVCAEEADEARDSEEEYFSAEEDASQDTRGGSIFQSLSTLKDSAQFTQTRPKVNEDEYITNTQTLMYTLNQLYDGELEAFIREKTIAEQLKRARQGPHGSQEEPLRSAWEKVHHCIGRLRSYFLAVKILLSARRYWPELFDDVEITPLPSSRPDRDPPHIRRSADRIIYSMLQAQTTDRESIINTYRQNSDVLKAWGLDRRILEVTHHSHFRPIVHAEVLVDDAIRRAQRRDAAAAQESLEFFRESELGRYIGSSKPTCRLCALYFAAQPDGVKVRPSHGNLYCNWRVPEVFESDGVAVAQRRNAVLDQMVEKLRADTWKAIRNKSAPWKAWDSNNTATNPLPDRITATTDTEADAHSA